MASRTTSATRPSPPVAAKQPLTAPSWLRFVVLGLAAFYLLCIFSSRPVADSDTWWHLTVGKYIWQNHRLPVPDPFAFTTDMGKPVYPGELTTRHFNLTHEWGMELIYYVVQAATGFGGMVLFRSLLLMIFCGVTGWLAARRSGRFYRGVAAGVAAAFIASSFATDRAYLASFVLVTLTVAAFETRRGLWLLPPAFLIWANCHGGYLMGWAVVGAYSADALYQRFRGKPLPDERTVWIVSALAIFATFWNPNGWNAIEVMRNYRASPMQISIFEWNYPAWWPPDRFNILMVVSTAVLLWRWRRVRFVDWLLFLGLGAAAAMALRNVIFVAFIGPVMLATYVPVRARPLSAVLQYAAALVLLAWTTIVIAVGSPFQFRAETSIYPADAADFLIAHGVTGRIFNTYEQGGYLMWRLWPRLQVFIDGRALNESVWNDYRHIAFNADYQGGKTTNELLRQYDVRTIIMNGFDFGGELQLLAAALADPVQKEWKLVYEDNRDVVYMRDLPPGVTALPSLTALDALETQCTFLMDNGGNQKCARSLGDMFFKIGDPVRARKWVSKYLQVDSADPAARALMQRLIAAGR